MTRSDLTEKHSRAKNALELWYSVIKNAPQHSISYVMQYAGCDSEDEAIRIEADLCREGLIPFVPSCMTFLASNEVAG